MPKMNVEKLSVKMRNPGHPWTTVEVDLSMVPGGMDAIIDKEPCFWAHNLAVAVREAAHLARGLPSVGMGCSWSIGSDRFAGTIANISPSGHQVGVREDVTTLVSGDIQSETQEYTFEPNPNAEVQVFTRRNDQKYRMKGATTFGTLRLGVRSAYRDPSF